MIVNAPVWSRHRASARRLAVVNVVSAGGESGGAERFFAALCRALSHEGEEVDRIDLPCDESTIDGILQGYERFYDLDLNAYAGVISTKAPAYALRHPNHVCYLTHTMRSLYDMFAREHPSPEREMLRFRETIHFLDALALSPPRVRKLFVIGHTVRRRLLEYNALESQVLHLALDFPARRAGSFDYLFLPGRLHRWKRVDLVIDAMRSVDRPLAFHIAGAGEDESEFRARARGDPRIVFHGRVGDEELARLYAGALAVAFVPANEDFGFVTLEAFASGKPVITCVDSGEPADFVRQSGGGLVCDPTPQALAREITSLFDHPERAREMGRKGAEFQRRFTWKDVAETLLASLDG